jgi:hypothetical protein
LAGGGDGGDVDGSALGVVADVAVGAGVDLVGEDFAAGVAGFEAEDVELVGGGEVVEEVDEAGVDDAVLEVAACGWGEGEVGVLG